MTCSSWPVLEHSVTFSVQMMCLIMCSLGAILFNPLSFGEGFWSFMTKNSEVVGTCWFPLHVPEKFSLFSKNYFRWTLRIACLNHLYELFKGKGSLTLLFPPAFQKHSTTQRTCWAFLITSWVKPNLEFLFWDLLSTNTPATSASDT